MEVPDSRGLWGNPKEVSLPEWKVQIWEWWAKELEREADPRALPCLARAFDLHPEGCRELLIEYIFSLRQSILCRGKSWGRRPLQPLEWGPMRGLWAVFLGRRRGRDTEK